MSSSASIADETLQLTVAVVVRAVPGTEIEVLVGGAPAGTARADDDGLARFELRPTIWQILTDATVAIQYAPASGTDVPATTVRLSRLIRGL